MCNFKKSSDPDSQTLKEFSLLYHHYIIFFSFTHIMRYVCWSPNWNEPQTDSGTPRFGNQFGESPFRYGDPRSDMGSPF
jgi:hypothetical protein